MTVENYLYKKYKSTTAKAYARDIKKYLERHPRAKTARYSDIINYLEYQRRKQSPGSLSRILQSIKKYYNYLIATDQREDHPCEKLKIKDHYRKDVQLQDLFSEKELERLLEIKSRYKILKKRNQLMLSLLIYQGLTSGELVRLEIKDLDLERGTIYIKSSHRQNARTLKLRSNQILIAHQYINEDRVKLLKVETENLVITKRGSEEKGEGISYLVSRMQIKFPNRNLNPKTIRQSVIRNKLKGGGELRSVQVFAGHKYPSSTERYRQNNIEELRSAIRKHHPLN